MDQAVCGQEAPCAKRTPRAERANRERRCSPRTAQARCSGQVFFSAAYALPRGLPKQEGEHGACKGSPRLLTGPSGTRSMYAGKMLEFVREDYSHFQCSVL